MMLFFNIDKQKFKAKNQSECGSDVSANQQSAYALLHSVRFGLLPLFPFRTSYHMEFESEQSAPQREEKPSVTIPKIVILSKFIGLFLIACVVYGFLSQHFDEARIERSIVENPRPNDFFFIDYSKYLNEGYYQKRVVAAKVESVDNGNIELRFSRYNYSRERDLVISARSDNFVQKGYFLSKTEQISKEKVMDLYANGTIYMAHRPQAMKLYGGFVVKPSKPKPLYNGFELNAANQSGIEHFQERDYTGALESFSKAAEQGDAWGQFNLAEMYLYGQGVEPNPELAAMWLKRSAEQGNLKAQALCASAAIC